MFVYKLLTLDLALINISVKALENNKNIVLEKIESESSISKEVSASSEEIAVSTQEIARSTGVVNNVINDLSNMSKKLMDNVDKFKM